MTDPSYALITEVSRLLMADGDDRPMEDTSQVRADIGPYDRAVSVEEATQFTVDVTNLGSVIRAFEVSVLGVDPVHVIVDTPVVDLFPWERKTVTVTLVLPADMPSGRHRLAIEVREAASPGAVPAVAEFVVEVEGRPDLSMTVEPATLEIGKSGTFLLHVLNTGNTVMEPALSALDPERLTTVTYDPPKPRLQPGERAIVTARVTGPRPWFGMPAVRVLDVQSTAQDVMATSTVAVLQRPRISRRLVSLLGLLLVITLFAFVISRSFGRVAELSAQNQRLLERGLGLDEVAGDRVSPAGVQGTVASITGIPIEGAALRLFDEGNLVQPVQTTVTNGQGEYAFGAVADGSYLLQVEAAGFGEGWFGGASPDAATLIVIEDAVAPDPIAFELVGRPGSVEGVVLGTDVAGALVQVRIPEDVIDDSEFREVASVVASVEIDATGVFVLGDLATPAVYQLIVSKPGYATREVALPLKAGEQRERVEVLLQPGIGLISGRVLDSAGQPIGGVEVRATDGKSELVTRSLSGELDAGLYTLRNLTTPGTYTLTFSAPGYFRETMTVRLGAEDQRPSEDVVLVSDTGSIQGQVLDRDGESPLGGVSVTVTGADLQVTTQSLTVGDVGSWFVDALPVPGTYNIRFSAPGYLTTAITVGLSPGPEAAVNDVTALLTPESARVEGVVRDPEGKPISGVEITMEAADVQRSTRTSDIPAGGYVFDEIPPGAYTFTFRRAGSTPQTLLVDLAPGEQRVLDDVVLEAQARIEGRVTRNGVGAADVGVLVYRKGDYPEGLVAETVTGPDGVFELVGLDAPETYVIDFQVPAGGQVVESRTEFLQPNETKRMQVDL